MKIATILPLEYLYLEEANDYHMALAHLVAQSPEYADWFAGHSAVGDHVMMDNGVVETGKPMEPEKLREMGLRANATEIVLPDVIGQAQATLSLSAKAMVYLRPDFDLMVVPQGKDAVEWLGCLEEMITWPVRSIGISKFAVLTGVFPERYTAASAVRDCLKRMRQSKEIHLLGSPLGTHEIQWFRRMYGDLEIRGVDSAHAAFCAAGGTPVTPDGTRVSGIEHDFDFLTYGKIPPEIMHRNYRDWLDLCQ